MVWSNANIILLGRKNLINQPLKPSLLNIPKKQIHQKLRYQHQEAFK
jgi:hypothetical protein